MGASAGNRRHGFCTWDFIKRLAMRKPGIDTQINSLGIIGKIIVPTPSQKGCNPRCGAITGKVNDNYCRYHRKKEKE